MGLSRVKGQSLNLTIARQSKIFWICPEWLMWFISWLNGHLKGGQKSEQVMEGWWGHTWGALKRSKLHQNGHHSMTEQSVSNFSCVANMIDVRTSQGGVIGIQKWIILVTQDKFKTLCSVLLWGLFWSILVHFGAHPVQPHDPTMTCTDSSTLPSVHLLQKWIVLVTQDKFEILRSVMQWTPFWCIIMHFLTFWCTLCATPWPLHDLLWLLYPFKCPFIPEMELSSHSGQIRNALLSHGTVTILVFFGAFWSILVHFVGDPTTPLYWIFIKSSKTCFLHTKSF